MESHHVPQTGPEIMIFLPQSLGITDVCHHAQNGGSLLTYSWGCLKPTFLSFLFFFFSGGIRVWTQGLKLARQVLYNLSHTSSPFCVGYFQDRVSQTIYLGWPGMEILLMSASLVASITDISHQHPAETYISSACLANARSWVQTPVLPLKRNIRMFFSLRHRWDEKNRGKLWEKEVTTLSGLLVNTH
jgi:hypothetical protein